MGALSVAQATREGWTAFRRAPVVFVAFSLLLALLQLPISVLQDSLGAARSHGGAPSALLLSRLCGVPMADAFPRDDRTAHATSESTWPS